MLHVRTLGEVFDGFGIYFYLSVETCGYLLELPHWGNSNENPPRFDESSEEKS